VLDYVFAPHLGRLYHDHHAWLRSWLQRRLGNAGDAADLAHDAFLRLLVKPKHFGSAPEARVYLRSMANGLCIDLWRHREVEQAWLDTLAARPDALEPSPEHRAIVIETLCEIGTMLAVLPEKTATAFMLAQVHGMAYKDISVELGVSERTIKKYMAQAMLQCALIEARLER